MASSDLSITTTGGGLRTLDFESDHRAVEAVINIRGFQRSIEPTVFDYDHIDRNRLNGILARELPGLELPVDRNVTIEDIDENIGHLNTVFNRAIEQSIPRISYKNKGLPKLPSNILRFMAERKRLRRRIFRTIDPARYLILKADIRNLDKIIQGAISVFQESYWQNYLKSIRVNNKTYRQVKRAAGILKREPISDLIGPGGTLLSEDTDKAEWIADRFCEVHKGGSALRNASFESIVNREVSTLAIHNPSLTFGRDAMADGTRIEGSNQLTELSLVTSNDIRGSLKMRHNKKSSGNDNIPDIVLKCTNNVTWHFLAVLFNHCMNLGYFPVSWKEAYVVPILKPKSDPKRVENYRPISLLTSFGKLLERFLLTKIEDRIIDGGIIKDFQFGFVKGRSTTHALLVFSDYVTTGLNRRCPTLAVSLDLAKAFDSVWQEGIIYKMIELGFDHSTCRMVASFLKNRRFKVKVGSVLSTPKSIEAGVPQGSLLGPVLYNIFIADIPQPTDGDLLLLYADDMLVAASGPRAATINRRVNNYLDSLSEYFKKWGLRLNIDKTEGILIKGKRGRLYPNARKYIPNLIIDGIRVRTPRKIKYLGVIFTEDFEFYRHVDYILQKVKRIYYLYNRLLRSKNGLSTRIRLLIYKQVIRPLMAYAFPVWFGISSHQMERLRVWERRILAPSLGLFPRVHYDDTFRRPPNRSIYGAMDFNRVDAFLVGCAIRFLERANSLDNVLVANCFQTLTNLETLRNNRYFLPVDLLALRDGNLLYQGADLLFYHRRFNTLNLTDTVYSTAQ